jgi:hypothetical protein
LPAIGVEKTRIGMRLILLAGAIALALSTTGCGSGSEAERTATETVRPAAGTLPAPEVATCSSRSEASFPGAFQDPANTVVGPFVLVGGARPTPAAVVASHGGQKHPVLVRAGRTVTVRVPPGARDHVSLGYGSLPQGEVGYPDGHPAVTFVACQPDEGSGSWAGLGEPVTFWSGFVFARKPSCAPLDIQVGGDVRGIEIPLGDRC